MKKFKVKVYWEMCGEVEVEANSPAEAAKLAIDAPLPSSDNQEYVSDSANVDEELDVVEVDVANEEYLAEMEQEMKDRD